jgi:4-amino-4-deoxy-L-arabinose transferase-like glycosyltransferase
MGSLTAKEVESPATRPAASADRIYYKTILTLALVSRLGIVWWVLALHPPAWLFNNDADLAFLAQSLSSGRGFSSIFGGSTGPTAFLAPGYPAMVGLIFRLFGSYSFASATVVLAMQTLFAVLTVAVIMHVARSLFCVAAANLAGAFWALSPPLLWLPAVFWDTGLSTLLLLGMVALSLRCVGRPGMGLWAAMGAYVGLAMLVNPSLMLALFAVLLWSAYQTRSALGYELLTCFLVSLAIFAPWPIRNALALHAFIPLRSSFGYELWQGNHAGATGIFDPTLYPLHSQREYSDYAVQGEVAYVRNKSSIARDYIRAHPGKFIKLSVRRARLFWIGPSEADFKMLEPHAVLTSLLGLLGLAVVFKHNWRVAIFFLLPLLVFPLPYYITHPDFRFRIVLDPLLTILSAHAITRFRMYPNQRGQTG